MTDFISYTHHRRSIRLQDYDYSQAGAYFVTICSHEHKCIFGNITDGKMILSQSGEIVGKWWQKIPQRFPTMEFDVFCTMPNHFHGILVLQDAPITSHEDAETASLREIDGRPLSRRGLVSKPRSQFGRRPLDSQHPELGQIIAYFKYLTTKETIPFPARLAYVFFNATTTSTLSATKQTSPKSENTSSTIC
jgi:hypothetical protein